MNDNSRRYFITAIIFTVVAVLAGILFMLSTADAFSKGCALVLVAMCLVAQWTRYVKAKK